MLCGDVTDVQPGAAGSLGGYWADRGDLDRGNGVQNVDAEGLRAVEQRANGVGAGEQEPIKGAQIAEGLIQGSEIAWRTKRDHGLEQGLGTASFQFANERFGLVRCAREENGAAGERG